MAALQYVCVPGYSAILFRRTYKALALPGALIDRSKEWLAGTDAHWSEEHKMWTFPSDATLSFGYLDNPGDKWQYQSAEFQMCGFDEVTQFLEDDYRYLFSRLRRLEDTHIPIRMRAASNPGGIGHDWVKQRFMIEGYEHGRVFIPSKLQENPYLDQVNYIESLNELDPITRRQYLDGDWTARHGGSMFQREWFKIVKEAPALLRKVRYWDKASTEPTKGKEPDWTVGLLMGEANGQYWILDVKRIRGPPPTVQSLIKQTTQLDGNTPQYMEQEPGSSGVDVISHYSREVLNGYEFRGDKVTGPKTERAGPLSSAAEAGNVYIIQAPWNTTFLDEVEAFPDGLHDDQVDCASGAFTKLKQPKPNASFLLR
jgi:predicted phage terminase large subunit-like protein